MPDLGHKILNPPCRIDLSAECNYLCFRKKKKEMCLFLGLDSPGVTISVIYISLMFIEFYFHLLFTHSFESQVYFLIIDKN